MTSSPRDNETLNRIVAELTEQDPDLVARFRDWNRSSAEFAPQPGNALRMLLWTPRSFLCAWMGVLLLAAPACYTIAHLPSLAASLLGVPVIAGCLLPMYRHLHLCEQAPLR
jgi:hypothetical protein